MLKIPYGESNFKTVISQGYFYQDRSMYLQILEDHAPSYVLFLRPRRFGKSLFISMMHYYYGIEYKNEFQDLFGKLAIGQAPTSEANNSLVLYFEFSRIDTRTEDSTFDGFLHNVKNGVKNFMDTYFDIFSPEMQQDVLAQSQPNNVLMTLFGHYEAVNIHRNLPKIYILVDEYDHFANELVSFDFDNFIGSVTKNGYVRKFFETIKTATGAAIVHKVFITGVSPVTLDSVSSGFNILMNISRFDIFHKMVGFEENEVKEILLKIGIQEDTLEQNIDNLRTWYNGYLFSSDAIQRIYNPDMILYFAKQYQLLGRYPDQLLDPNIASDYSKIRNLFKIQNKELANLEILETLINKREVTSELTLMYNFERSFNTNDLISLLFYMGFLTIKERELGSYVFQFPNQVIEKLYLDYFVSFLSSNLKLPIDNSTLNKSLQDLAINGNPEAFYKEVKEILTALSNRDMQGFSENSLKAIFISLLHQQKFYYIHSEYETKRTYVDIFLEGIKNYNVPFEVAFELKYAKISENINVESELDKAETQLLNYLHSKKFNDRPNVKAYVVLVHGLTIHSREINIL